MSPPRLPLPEAPPVPAATTAGYRAAEAVSYLLNPLVWPAVGFGLVLGHFGAPPAEVALAVGLALTFFCLLPLAYLVVLWRRGEVESLEVRERSKRFKPLAVGIASYVAGLALLAATVRTAAPLVLALGALYPLNSALVMLVTLRTKVSIHTTAVAGFVAGLVFVVARAWPALPPGRLLTPLSVALLVPLIPLTMWARVRAKAHTVGQVLGGAALGFGLPLVELHLLLRALGL